MWFPECAYRPNGVWEPPIPWGKPRVRCGLEHLAADEGIHHFFVESHLIENSRSEQVFNDDMWCNVGWEEAEQYPSRGWRSVNEAHGVNSDGNGLARLWAIGRDQEVCEKVWSGTIGYPADGAYLEFHKQWGPRRGLKYWKITGPQVRPGRQAPVRTRRRAREALRARPALRQQREGPVAQAPRHDRPRRHGDVHLRCRTLRPLVGRGRGLHPRRDAHALGRPGGGAVHHDAVPARPLRGQGGDPARGVLGRGGATTASGPTSRSIGCGRSSTAARAPSCG